MGGRHLFERTLERTEPHILDLVSGYALDILIERKPMDVGSGELMAAVKRKIPEGERDNVKDTDILHGLQYLVQNQFAERTDLGGTISYRLTL